MTNDKGVVNMGFQIQGTPIDITQVSAERRDLPNAEPEVETPKISTETPAQASVMEDK